MKKSKRSFELEDQESGRSGKGGILLEKHEDEEIIDLEDIIELDGQAEEEDELDLGVELIDLEADMDFKDIGADIGPDDDALEEELLKDLPVGTAAKGRKDRREVALPDEDETEDLFQGFPKDARESKPPAGEGKMDLADVSLPDDPLEGLVFAVDEKPEADMSQKRAPSMKIAALEKPEPPAKVRTAVPASDMPAMVGDLGAQLPEDRAPRGEKDLEGDVPSVDGLIDDLETRLTDMVREMVEARLPDIVRTVLREEIQKLKAELKS